MHVATVPQSTANKGKYIAGRTRLRIILEGTSHTRYEVKKTRTMTEYWVSVKLKSSSIPPTFACGKGQTGQHVCRRQVYPFKSMKLPRCGRTMANDTLPPITLLTLPILDLSTLLRRYNVQQHGTSLQSNFRTSAFSSSVSGMYEAWRSCACSKSSCRFSLGSLEGL